MSKLFHQPAKDTFPQQQMKLLNNNFVVYLRE